MLLQRILTAFVLIPLIIAGIIFLPPTYFSTGVGVFILVGAWEWSALIGFKKISARWGYVLCILLGMLISIFLPQHFILGFTFIVWIWYAVAIVHYQHKGTGLGFQLPVVRWLVGLLILVSTWIAIVTLKTGSNLGTGWLILTLLIFGMHALCSRVSPKKTWEGFVGGVILAVMVTVIGGVHFPLSFQQYSYLIFLTLITALFSVVGDLGVSMLKRMINVKDTGNIFPGHGGMLDRMDSVMSATVVFALGLICNPSLF